MLIRDKGAFKSQGPLLNHNQNIPGERNYLGRGGLELNIPILPGKPYDVPGLALNLSVDESLK